MKLPHEVDGVLRDLLSGIRQALADNLVGVYLRGSLATGDFIPETSDIDVRAMTEHPVDDVEFAALAALHAQLSASPDPFGSQIEVAYIDRAALRRFRPGLRHPTLGRGETLAWAEHHTNWILERWTVRERGINLLGPNPQVIIAPVSPDELKQAVRARLNDWADFALASDDSDWLLPRNHKAYAVETMCRGLHTLACGELTSKRQAVVWVLETIPEPWRSIVRRSQAWRTDNAFDPDIVPEVKRFVLWAASYLPAAA
jgi:hypothetical protein